MDQQERSIHINLLYQGKICFSAGLISKFPHDVSQYSRIPKLPNVTDTFKEAQLKI